VDVFKAGAKEAIVEDKIVKLRINKDDDEATEKSDED